jgi:hypothetical protein
VLNTFEIAQSAGNIIVPALVNSLCCYVARSQAKALKEAQPSLQKYTGRYFLTDPNAVRTVTFSEFAVSIVNQKLVVTVPELLPGSVVYMKETPLEPFGGNVFHVAGGSFYGNFMTFESNQDGSMVLKWRNYAFKRQP